MFDHESMKRVLVTGGKGFIGSHLVKELRRRGREVWACDLMHSGEENYMRCDVSRYRQVERLFEGQEFDYVYHVAAEYGRWNGEDYYENLWYLVEKYDGMFVAVHKQEIVAFDEDPGKLSEKILAKGLKLHDGYG